MGAPRSPVMVGREHELERLVDAWRQADEGRAQVVVLRGEAGIGKTRLVRAFIEDLERREPKVEAAWGHAVPLAGGAIPYGVASDLLCDLVASVGVDIVEHTLGDDVRALGAVVPGLGGGARRVDRLALFGASQHLLRRLATDRTIVLVVEDLHWADAASADLFAYWARTLDRARLLLVLTSRNAEDSDDLAAALSELSRLPHASDLAVGPLSALETAAQVEALAPADFAVPVEQIRALSGGNPLYVEELVAAGGAGVPDSLRLDLTARLASLDEPARRVLGCAALESRPFRLETLAEVSGVGADVVDTAMDAASAQGLVDPASTGRWRFHHELLREAVATTVPPTRQLKTHRRWAEVLGADPAAPVADIIGAADHWEAVGPSSEAYRALVRAADAVERSRAGALSSNRWTRVLRLLNAAPQMVDEEEYDDALAGFSRVFAEHREAVEIIDLAEAGRSDSTEARRTWLWLLRYRVGQFLPERARPTPTVAELVAARDRLLDSAAVRPSALMLDVLVMLAYCLSNQDAVVENRTTVDALEAKAAELGLSADYLIHVAMQRLSCLEVEGTGRDRVLLLRQCVTDATYLDQSHRATAQWLLGLQLLGNGDVRGAVLQGEESLRLLHDDMADPVWYLAASGVAEAHTFAGGWDRAVELLEPCASTESTAIHLRAVALIALIALRRGDAYLAGEVLGSSREYASLEDSAIGYWQRFMPVLARASLLERVDPADARETLEPLLALTQARYLELVGACLVVAARLAWRDPASGPEYASRVRALAASTLVDGPLDAAYLGEVEAHLARAEGVESVDSWKPVVAAWDELGVPFSAAEAGLRLAEVQLGDADRDGATDSLGRALALADGLGARPLADEIHALAARARLRLPGHERSGELERGGLTEREFEVLQLLVTGQTNDQIGAALFMSPRTASVHVSRILAKLGAANRTEVASIAHRRGMLEG